VIWAARSNEGGKGTQPQKKKKVSTRVYNRRGGKPVGRKED